MKKLRVLLVDDEIMIREGFKRLFDWEAHDCQVVGEAADGMEALRLQITDYILKPVDYEEFGSCIDNLKISLFEQRVAAEEPAAQEERTINGLTRYLQEHLAEEVSLSVLAEQFHLNPQYISQLFKSEIGVGFLTYLTNIRMEKAKKLLLSTSLSIAEMAEQSGYGDYRVFTKVFKKTEGSTPSQYRRDFLEKNP